MYTSITSECIQKVAGVYFIHALTEIIESMQSEFSTYK